MGRGADTQQDAICRLKARDDLPPWLSTDWVDQAKALPVKFCRGGLDIVYLELDRGLRDRVRCWPHLATEAGVGGCSTACFRHPSHSWHNDGMARTRLSTTVDAALLEDARRVRSGTTDAALVDEALAALLARYRSAEVDASYAVYDEHPLDEPDEWGDLETFRRAVAAS